MASCLRQGCGAAALQAIREFRCEVRAARQAGARAEALEVAMLCWGCSLALSHTNRFARAKWSSRVPRHAGSVLLSSR